MTLCHLLPWLYMYIGSVETQCLTNIITENRVEYFRKELFPLPISTLLSPHSINCYQSLVMFVDDFDIFFVIFPLCSPNRYEIKILIVLSSTSTIKQYIHWLS